MFYEIEQENACTIVSFLLNLWNKGPPCWNKSESEAVARRCSVKKLFLKISQNSQDNTHTRASLLIKLQTKACDFISSLNMAQGITAHLEFLWKVETLLSFFSRRYLEGTVGWPGLEIAMEKSLLSLLI